MDWPPPSRKPNVTYKDQSTNDSNGILEKCSPASESTEQTSIINSVSPVKDIDGKVALNQELVAKFADHLLVRIAFVGAVGTGNSVLLGAIADWYNSNSPQGQKDPNEQNKTSEVIPLAQIYEIADLLDFHGKALMGFEMYFRIFSDTVINGNPVFGRRAYLYDFPGAETTEAYTDEYYQALVHFDAVFVVTGNRFTEFDGKIADYCAKAKIPYRFVRSKTDDDLQNIIDQEECSIDDAILALKQEAHEDFQEWAAQHFTECHQSPLLLVNANYWTDVDHYQRFQIDEQELVLEIDACVTRKLGYARPAQNRYVPIGPICETEL